MRSHRTDHFFTSFIRSEGLSQQRDNAKLDFLTFLCVVAILPPALPACAPCHPPCASPALGAPVSVSSPLGPPTPPGIRTTGH